MNKLLLAAAMLFSLSFLANAAPGCYSKLARTVMEREGLKSSANRMRVMLQIDTTQAQRQETQIQEEPLSFVEPPIFNLSFFKESSKKKKKKKSTK